MLSFVDRSSGAPGALDAPGAQDGAGALDAPPSRATTSAPTPADPSDIVVYEADEGRDLVDLSVDPAGEHLVVTTIGAQGCSVALTRVDLASGAVTELGSGFGASVATDRLAWNVPSADDTCGDRVDPASPVRRVVDVESDVVVVVDGDGTRTFDPPPMGSGPGPGSGSGSRALHPAVLSPDGELVALVRGSVGVVDVETAVVAGQAGQPADPTAATGTDGASAASWVTDDLLVSRQGDVLALDRVVRASDGGPVTVERVSSTATAGTEVVAVDAVIDSRDGEPGTTIGDHLAVTAAGDLIVVPASEQPRIVRRGVVDAALVRPTRPEAPVTDDTGPAVTSPAGTTPPPPASDPPRALQSAQTGGTRNVLGWPRGLPVDNLPPDEFVLAINDGCVTKLQGDRYSARHEGSAPGCDGPANPEYRPSGYRYVIDVPEDHGAIDVVMLPIWGTQPPGVPTFRVEDPAGVVLAEETFDAWNTGSARDHRDHKPGDLMQRVVLTTIPADAPAGGYAVVVRSDAAGDGFNAFALGAFPAGTREGCDSASDARCPRVYASTGLSIFVMGDRATARVPLAVVPEDVTTLVVELWDPGEGARYLEVLRPDGSPAMFRWSVAGERGGQAVERLGLGQGQFDGKLVRIDVEVAGGPIAGQWSVAYETGDFPTDRTTWDVFVDR